ncbi:SNF2 family domain-containing protein [Stagonosporopsis vannaccii]|nr:SNF2 family domain-containing protein [Stagonosporopsis vannaccii]
MSIDALNNQSVPLSDDVAGIGESSADNEATGPHTEEPTTFTRGPDDQLTTVYENQHENILQSVEDDPQPGTPTTNTRADNNLETEQYAQRPSHELIDHDVTMEEVADEQEDALLPTTDEVPKRSGHEDADFAEPLSLFIPERGSASRSPVPPPVAPCSSLASPEQISAPARQVEAPAKLSVLAKFRNMQRAAQARKNAFNKHAAAPQPSAYDLDPEAYLDSVTSGIKPPAGTYTVQVDEDEMAHRRALAEFQRQKRYYEKIKEEHNGHLPFRQDVEWMKIVGAEEARLKKRQRELALAQEGEEQEILPQVHFRHEEQDDDGSDGDFGGGSSSRKRRRGGQPSTESVSLTLQASEYQSMLVALDADKDTPKRKKKKDAAHTVQDQTPRSSAKGKGSKPKPARASRAKGAAGKSVKRPRKTAKDKRELERATRQACSLFNADVFEQQASTGAADQPVLQTRRKADALKELIASVPLQEKTQVRNDMNTLLQASKDFDGQGACKIAAHGNWLVRGMKTSLKGYQLLGTAFLRRRENDAHEPRDGLMADQMGLGKTLMMLANIVNSRDAMIRTKDNGPKTTLLVAGPALLTQWAAEIQQHTDCNMTVMRYGAGNRIDSTDALQVLQSHDIILTTYGEVMKSYPKNVPPVECQTAEQKIAWWKGTYESRRGVLHEIHFKRVVLDEAQAIKNHQARTSIACRALRACHKWASSGTPILNGLEELYPYFKFLNVPHTGSFKIFKQNYCGSGSGESAERLMARLSQFMIRRTHADRLFNAPILKLPQANQMTHWCEFNSVERSIYNIVHVRFATNINQLSENGTLAKSYSNVLVMLLRLRQLTAHVLMLQFVMRDLLQREDIEKIKKVVKKQAAASNSHQGRAILAIRKQLEAHEHREKRKSAARAARRLAAQVAAKDNNQEYVEPSDADEDDENDDAPVELPQDGELEGEATSIQRVAKRPTSGKAFGKSYNFKPYVNSLTNGDTWEKKKEQAKCGECDRQLLRLWLTSCGHLICEPCYEIAMSTAAEEGDVHATCKSCGSTFAACTPCDDDDDLASPSRGTRNKTAQKKKTQQERVDREDISNDWLSLGGEDVLPSAKTLAIKAQILNWIEENPSVKIIIYTQFLAMIRILARVCQQETWGTEQYHGKLSLGARDKAIKKFADDPSSKVLLASLRCGGLGLNLTMASKVIIIDPWWNQASEQQAFCRVFRIGQQDETFMSRMCVKNTVDERLIEMQKKKQREIDEVMEDRGKKTRKQVLPCLDIADLMRLFGNIEEGEDGRPFIVVDNPNATGGFFADQDHEGYADDH